MNISPDQQAEFTRLLTNLLLLGLNVAIGFLSQYLYKRSKLAESEHKQTRLEWFVSLAAEVAKGIDQMHPDKKGDEKKSLLMEALTERAPDTVKKYPKTANKLAEAGVASVKAEQKLMGG